jgi:lysozyme
MIKTSIKGLNLIKKYEGLYLKKYICPAGKPTIGYGHVILPSENYSEITIKQAEELLKKDIAWAGKVINTVVYVPLTQNQFDALVSFVFNCGSGNFIRSTCLKLLNQKNYEKAAEELKKFIHVGTKVLKGLVNRREEETKLFLESNK